MLIVFWTVYHALVGGLRQALLRGYVPVLLLAPTWMIYQFFSVQLEFRTAAGLGVVLALLLAPGTRLLGRWLVADTLAVVLFLVQLCSQTAAGELRPFVPPELARMWLLPYFMGRIMFGSHSDIDRALKPIVLLCLFLSLYSIIEAVSKVNIVNTVLRKEFAVLEAGEGYRYGLKRAQGPLIHPIYFGNMLVLMLPWALEAFGRRRERGAPWWWPWLLPIMGVGIFVTVSRGAWIAAVITLGVVAFFRNPKWRKMMVISTLVGGALLYFNKDALMELVGKAGGETAEDVSMVRIRGREYEYTGTKHRVLLWIVYEEAINKAGWLGFGWSLDDGLAKADIEFEEAVELRFGSIDNHYLLFYLQRGIAGVAAFILLGLAGIAQAGRVAWDPRLPHSRLAAGMCGALLAITLVAYTVAFELDYGTVWLFCVGMTGSLRLLPRSLGSGAPRTTAPTPKSPATLRPRLTPGYAPPAEDHPHNVLKNDLKTGA